MSETQCRCAVGAPRGPAAGTLVESPLDWPGPTSVRALYDGSLLVRGEWVDRTALFRARENGQDVTEDDFTTSETLELSPLPCYEHWSAEQYHAWGREMIADIEHEGRVRRRTEGKRVLGVAKLLAADPLATPAPAKRTPAPLFLASCREDRKEAARGETATSSQQQAGTAAGSPTSTSLDTATSPDSSAMLSATTGTVSSPRSGPTTRRTCSG